MAPPAAEVATALSRTREHFLGQLTDILSHGVRHVIAPPGAAWDREGEAFGSASPYANKARPRL